LFAKSVRKSPSQYVEREKGDLGVPKSIMGEATFHTTKGGGGGTASEGGRGRVGLLRETVKKKMPYHGLGNIRKESHCRFAKSEKKKGKQGLDIHRAKKNSRFYISRRGGGGGRVAAIRPEVFSKRKGRGTINSPPPEKKKGRPWCSRAKEGERLKICH